MKKRFIVKRPQEKAEVHEEELDFRKIQKLVGGVFDVVEMPGVMNTDIFLNDISLADGMPSNIILPERGEFLAGTIVVAGCDPETGETVGLSSAQEKKAMDYLRENEAGGLNYPQAHTYSMAKRENQRMRMKAHEEEAYGLQ